MALQRLQEACEKAKKELSTAQSTDINLPFITADATGPKHLQITITRAQFEQMCDGLIERCRGPVVQALKDAKLDPKEIDEVVLVGGSTRIPKVQELVKKLFNKEPHKGVNPDEVVALGAAIQGCCLTSRRSAWASKPTAACLQSSWNETRLCQRSESRSLARPPITRRRSP